MSLTKARRPTLRAALMLLSVAIAGCVAGGYGYDGGDGGYGVGFYEPYGEYDYGGWGGGYLVGPPLRGGRAGGRGSGRAPGRAPHPSYQPAPASRPMPSIPSGSRGAARGGGGRH